MGINENFRASFENHFFILKIKDNFSFSFSFFFINKDKGTIGKLLLKIFFNLKNKFKGTFDIKLFREFDL